ncbi:MAG: Asp23/Gls24 family envelope stress response protein [bacterium]
MCAEKKMTVQSEEKMGRIDVAESVVALIAFKEAMEVDGVVGTTGGLVEDITSFVRKGDAPKGVRVTRNEEGLLEIDLSIIVEYGRDIRQLAASLQIKVMDEVEKMTGGRPTTVNINLVSLHIPQKGKDILIPELEPEAEPSSPAGEQ